MCFDNSFSKLSEKMLFFEVIINSQSGAGRGPDEWADVATTESEVEYKLEDIRVRGKKTKTIISATCCRYDPPPLLQTTLKLSDVFLFDLYASRL